MITKINSLVEQQLEMSQYIGRRKHSSQLSEIETDGLFERLKEVENWRIKTHALDRLAEKGIEATYQDIVSTIGYAEMVEYKINYNPLINRCDERVVLRSKAIVNRCYNLNVVYSLSENRIVTVWNNHINDRHDTLDWSIYDADMKVFGI